MNAPTTVLKQHLIDPEICIRCNTCEEMCPVDAITHGDDNYVVDVATCNFCMACIAPCPTGAIDNWRMVTSPWSLDEQHSWSELPAQPDLGEAGAALEAIDDEVDAIIASAHGGAGGKSVAPKSASKPAINLFNRAKPAVATVTGIYRLTADDASTDIRHVILDFGDTPFPVLEGQSIGIVPPGVDAEGAPHRVRLYSVASPRHGERPNHNNLSLTVKRVEGGVCSNWVCDLKKGDKVTVTGPFGATFLMPDDSNANIVMVCTGTGSAPFRGMTEWRRRTQPNAPGKMVLFFGARRPEELPYFGPLQKVPASLLAKFFAWSRVPGEPKVYVQDLMRREAGLMADLLRSGKTHLYLCGLKGMETGVDEALADVCRGAGLDWEGLRRTMREEGRYHVETY
ncbi:MAG: benzoyl-CoA 2,3-epoxidase subunit BoxA [Hyphomicrobiales bacterium]|nr:benzoyl-CoA 2,3-epoxidase subunit BoxA [Hyphomicrobiales bacterium]